MHTHVSILPQAPRPCMLLHNSEEERVMSDSLRPHEPQHTRLPCLSPNPRVHPTHVPCVGDALEPSHPLASPSPPALNLSQHDGLFK